VQLYRLLARRSSDAASVRAIAATLVAVACLAVALGVLRVEHEHEVLQLGYRIAHEQARLDALHEVRRRLDLERAALTAPDRIRRLATELGMTSVAPDRIRIVRRSPLASAEPARASGLTEQR
jgi:cell division protein FtsL